MNNKTLRKAQQNTRINWSRLVQGMQDGVSESPIFRNFSQGACLRTPYIIRVIGADSRACFSSNMVLNVQLQKKKTPYLDQTNDDTESGSLNAEETIRTETKLPLRKSLSQ